MFFQVNIYMNFYLRPVSTGTLKYSKESTQSSCISSDRVFRGDVRRREWRWVGSSVASRNLILIEFKDPFFNELQPELGSIYIHCIYYLNTVGI